MTTDLEAVRRVDVGLGERSYPIVIGHGLIGAAGRLIAADFGGARALVVTDETVAPLHLPALTGALEDSGIPAQSVVVAAGEATKSFAALQAVVDAILEARLERGDLVIALGGGVVGDLAGFAAAIARRGMPFVQVPTTLLAQVDSSVGGKTGINTRQGKNLVGAFHQPRLVVCDTDLLRTLPARDLRAGYAEVAKYGLIDDPSLFAWLEANLAGILGLGEAVVPAVAACCEAKARVVAADERESGARALLNLGHTFAHAFEASAGYDGRLVHGEAVALGTAMAFRFSERLGLCPAADVGRVERHLRAAGLPVRTSDVAPLAFDGEHLLATMRQDKKARRQRLTFILVRGIGEAFVETGVDAALVTDFLEDELAP